MVSIAIIGLLAVIVVVNLNSGKRIEQLSNAARQLTADIRGMQSRALSAGDVKACLTGGGIMGVCENSTALCADPATCAGRVPSAYGISVTTTSPADEYVLFVEIESSTLDYAYTGEHEKVMAKKIIPIGAQEVEIQTILTGKPAPLTPQAFGSVSFQRQSGTTRMNDGTALEPDIMVIRLRHKISNETLDIEVNRITGRVSIL